VNAIGPTRLDRVLAREVAAPDGEGAFAVKAAVHTPQPSAVYLHQQVETVPIRQLVWSCGCARLAALHVGQLHDGIACIGISLKTDATPSKRRIAHPARHRLLQAHSGQTPR
jgi:hypothetical protein